MSDQKEKATELAHAVALAAGWCEWRPEAEHGKRCVQLAGEILTLLRQVAGEAARGMRDAAWKVVDDARYEGPMDLRSVRNAVRSIPLPYLSDECRSILTERGEAWLCSLSATHDGDHIALDGRRWNSLPLPSTGEAGPVETRCSTGWCGTTVAGGPLEGMPVFCPEHLPPAAPRVEGVGRLREGLQLAETILLAQAEHVREAHAENYGPDVDAEEALRDAAARIGSLAKARKDGGR